MREGESRIFGSAMVRHQPEPEQCEMSHRMDLGVVYLDDKQSAALETT